MKRKIAIVLAAVMTFCSVYIAPAATFADINQVPWEGAKTYINKVSDLGIMVGDTNSKGQKIFRPKDNVTYCETAQLAYQVLSKNGKLKSTTDTVKKWGDFLKSCKIPEWAQPAVAYCLEYNILTANDVIHFVNPNTGASYNATREGVAVIFGKAISDMYSVNNSASLTYKDKANVASTSVPYVDLLSRLNILVGDNVGNFNPKSLINRSEISVIISKTHDTLSSGSGGTTNPSNPVGQAVRGTVVKMENMVGSYMITVFTTNNKNMGFIGNDTVFCVKEGTTTQIPFSSLGKGDVITVDYTGATINKITVNQKNYNGGSVDSASSFEGTIEELYGDYAYIYKDRDRSEKYYLSSSVEVYIDDSKSTLKELIDLNEESRIEGKFYLNSSGDIIKIEAEVSDESITGELYSVDTRDDEITIVTTSGSKKTYDVLSSASIRLYDKESSLSKVSDELDDETLYCKLFLNSSNKVIKLLVDDDEYEETFFEATITDVSSSKVSLKREGSSSTKSYYLADNVVIRYDGSVIDVDKLEDKVDDYTVKAEISLNSKGDVVKINAEESDEDYDGELTYISSSRIEYKNSKGKTVKYDLDDDATFRLDGSSSDYKEIRDAVDDGTVNVKITLDRDDEYVTKVEAFTKSESAKEGTLYSISSSTIKIKTSGGSTKSYDLLDDTTYRLNGSKSDYDEIRDLYDDDEDVDIKLTLNSRDEVTKVEATTSSSSSSSGDIDYVGKIYGMGSDYITVKQDNGKTTDKIDISSSAKWYLNGSSSSQSRVKDAYDSAEVVRVGIELSGSKAYRIYAIETDDDADKDEGTIKDYITSTSDITEDYIYLRGDKYYYDFSCDLKYNGKRYSKISSFVSDIKSDLRDSNIREVNIDADIINGVMTRVTAESSYR